MDWFSGKFRVMISVAGRTWLQSGHDQGPLPWAYLSLHITLRITTLETKPTPESPGGISEPTAASLCASLHAVADTMTTGNGALGKHVVGLQFPRYSSSF